MQYIVNETTFEIQVFVDGDDVPFLAQPTYPSGEPFDSLEEATAWAELYVNHERDKLFPPMHKGEEPTPIIDPVVE